MNRLSEITFRVPETLESRVWLGELCTLLAGVEYAESAGSAETPAGGVDRLTLTPPGPAGARPETVFQVAAVHAPEVVLDSGQSIGICDDDAPGTQAPRPRVLLADLIRRLAGHVNGVDHTGVNMPASATSPEQWQGLVGAVAWASTMYRYPTGEEWPFVIPSTAEELLGDIRDFPTGREPRSELVYDELRTQTEWQFALWTDLTRTELERLFPEPEGFTFPGLEDIFRVVTVHNPWQGLSIRFDLCSRIEEGPSDWETGEWLVTKGGRIR
jgi:hypothetical protein